LEFGLMGGKLRRCERSVHIRVKMMRFVAAVG
jgi:hypothetical protein